MSRKKALALLTAAGMLFGNAVFFPTIAVSAESQTITLTPNETKTITFTGELNEETNENERAWANLGDDKYKVLPVIQAAAAPQLGCSADEVAIEDITVTYDYAFTTEDSDLAAGDAGIGLDFYGTCMNTDYGSVALSTNSVPHSDALAGTDKTVTFSAMCPAGTNINRIWYFDLEIHGNGKLGESLTLTVKKIEASVRYEKSYNDINIPYSELQGKEAIKLTYNAGKATECGHPAGEHGAGFSGTYCPYAGVPVYCVSSDGSHGSDGSDGGEDVEYWFCAGEDKPVITAVVLLKEIYAKTGTPKAGETLTFYGGVMGEPVSYELIANYVPDDIIFNTGSVTSGTIQEGSDWDSTTNSAVPTGKPDLNIGEISLCEGSGAKRFEGYKALQIDYTAANTSHLSGISVAFQGWEADGVNWVQPYYAASGSGTIVIDLTPYQSKSYNNIFVYAVAPRAAYIGQEFSPGFTVTSARLLTEYDGSFSPTIPEIKPVNNISIPYSELQGKEAIKLTYNAEKANKCGHTTEHGAGYSGTYCPYAGVSVYCVSSDGSQGGEEVEYWLCASEDKAVITTVVLLKDIYAKTGTPKAGDMLAFYGNSTGEPVSYELIENYVLEDIVLKTGSVASGTIKEHMDWSPDGNIPTGKPDLNIGEISLCEGSGAKKFEGYKALQIDCTAADTSQLAGISVAFQGWEADGVGWVQPYYAASGSGTITIDLTPYQSKSYNNIYVYAVAPATAKIGNSFTPGFTVTSAKLLTAYDGSFTATIPEIKPVEEQPSDPSSPSAPSTPSAPSSPSSNSQSTPATTTEKAVEEINKAAEGTTVNISLKGSTVADKEIFIAIAGKDIDIKITVSGGVTVEINGKDVENAKNVDLGVKMNSNAIKEERVNEIANGKDTAQFSLKHNGDFGFKATFNLPVNKKYNGKYANIYWDNKGKLEFVGSSPVKNGTVEYFTRHASDYVMVFDDYAYGEDVSSASGVYESSESDSYEIFAAFVLMIGISAVTIKRFIVKSK